MHWKIGFFTTSLTCLALCSCATTTTTMQGPVEVKKMSITKQAFGKTKDGQPADLYTLTNAHGMQAQITNYGGIVTRLFVPDRSGKFEDVVLGYDNLDDYLKEKQF
jgi:aldose 1-epimerase